MPGPCYFQSVQVFRPTIGCDGRLAFGAALATISGSIWAVRGRLLTTSEGETFTTTAEGFLPATPALQRRDHLLVIAPASGARYEVVNVTSGHDARGAHSHVGVDLIAARAI